MKASPRIFVAGHTGMVGSALVRVLAAGGRSVITRTRAELDLADGAAVGAFFADVRPDIVFLAAAKVGGIKANATAPWDFIYENLQIETSVLGAALRNSTARVIFFGSSCIYPRLAQQPITEDALLTGPLEPTNEAYAIAKIAGLKLVDAANAQHGMRWVSVMPTNLYGTGDNFDTESSHVLPAMIRKFHDAKTALPGIDVTLWGSGTVRREFLHVDDLAAASLRLMDSDTIGLFNVGYGNDVTIMELATIVARVVGYKGAIHWDVSMPDGTPRKLLDSTRILATGWRPTINLEDGIARTYAGFLRGEGKR